MASTMSFAFPTPLLRLSSQRRLPPRTRLPLRTSMTTSVSPPTTSAPPLPNLRDIASAAPELVRPLCVYRGAAPSCVPPPHSSSDPSSRFLHSVSRFVDLRSRDERKEDPHQRLGELCGKDFRRRGESVPLLNRRLLLRGIAKTLPRGQVYELVAKTLRNPLSVRGNVTERMDQGGLVLLNRILIEASGASIAKAIRIIVDAILEQDAVADGESYAGVSKESSSRSFSSMTATESDLWVPADFGEEGALRPVYIYCSAGKDRTGLLVAVILSLLGASEDQIIRDYVKSAETWENGPYYLREDYSRRLEHTGLTPKTWLGAPAEVMEQTLGYIRRRFGSTEAYLHGVGFKDDDLASLYSVLARQ